MTRTVKRKALPKGWAAARRELTFERARCARAAVELKDRLGRAGLFKTMQLMDDVTTAIGYEIAELSDD